MKKPENPSVFPWNELMSIHKDNVYHQNEGLELRDYFAAKAIPEMVRQWSRFEKSIDFKDMNQGDAENIAEQSYAISDAMLKQREK